MPSNPSDLATTWKARAKTRHTVVEFGHGTST